MHAPDMSSGRYARYLAYAAGAALIGIGINGVLGDVRNTGPFGWARWFASGVLLHDLLLAPAIILVALLVGRVPPPYRRIAQAALVVGGSVTLVALPVVLGYGRRPDNPSQLPLSYGRNLTVLLVAIGLTGGVAAVVTALRRTRLPSIRLPQIRFSRARLPRIQLPRIPFSRIPFSRARLSRILLRRARFRRILLRRARLSRIRFRRTRFPRTRFRRARLPRIRFRRR